MTMNAVLQFPETANHIIDQYVVIDQKIKALQEQADIIKDELKKRYGKGTHRGFQYGIKIDESTSTTFLKDKLFEDLGLSKDEQKSYHTSKSILKLTVVI
jgi:hypothetical protein